MIYDALLAPTESPSQLRDIKKALLTYDKVFIIDPSDRELMPRNSLTAALGIPSLSIGMRAIRPLGKCIGYDEIYEKIYDQCKPAIQQDLIKVVSTFNDSSPKNTVTLGPPDLGDYPLNLQFVFALYRSIATKPEALITAIKRDMATLIKNYPLDPDIAVTGMGDATIGSSEPMPNLSFPNESKEINRFLTLIARARIASFIKFSGYCELKQLIPCFPDNAYAGILSGIIKNASSVLAEIEEDRFWSRRNRVLNICHQEFINDAILDSMSIQEVISLRTKAWGTQAKNRERFFEVIFDISSSIEDDKEFIQQATSQIHTYKVHSQSLEQERKDIGFSIKCDIGKAFLGGGSGLAGLELMMQTQSPLASIGFTLAAGGMYFFDKTKEYVPAFRSLKNEELEFKRGAGFAISNFYSSFKE